jgi:hypothetical protein
MFNQSFPIWDYGAWVYWNSRRGRVAPTGGTPFRHGDGFLDHNPSSSGSDNLIFDPARGVFREYSSGGDAEFPPSGIVTDGATNIWGADNTANVRGFTAEPGLAVTLPAGSDNREIVELLSGGPSDRVAFSNFTVSPLNAFRTFAVGADDYVFSVLIRRNDRGVVDSSTCELQVVDSGLVDRTTTATRYVKVGGQGWYLLYVAVTAPADTMTWRLNIVNGITNLRAELPGVYDGSAFGGEHVGWTPIRHTGGGDPFRSEHEISIVNGEFTITSGGWIGCTFVPIFPSPGDGAFPVAASYETSVLLSFRQLNSADERIRFIISSSAQAVRFDYDAVSAGAGTSLSIPDSLFKQGVPVGMVIAWGSRSGTLTYTLFANGQQIAIHSVAPIGVPDSNKQGEVLIGHQGSSNAANVSLQQVALGNKRLPRIAGRHLSSWFEKQARFVVGEFGA